MWSSNKETERRYYIVDMFIATRCAADDRGRQRRFHYYLTVEVIEAGKFCCEDYGVRVSEEGGRSCAVSSLTTSAERIDQLMTALVDNTVGPAGLRDVIDDWL